MMFMKTTTAKNLHTGQNIDTDAGPREILSMTIGRAPISGTEIVTLKIAGVPCPIYLKPGQRINVA